MSTTRLRSPAARATEDAVVIVSHGSPSDPEPQEAFIRTLAERVTAQTGLHVRGATLAQRGALTAALAGLSRPIVLPHFMSDGWFVSSELPRRLRSAGLSEWRTAPPMGLTEGLPERAGEVLVETLAALGQPVGETTLVIAAHGSPSDPRPAQATRAFSAALEKTCRFREVRIGYVDEEPSLGCAAAVEGPAIVLPFFAAKAGHVLIDLPEALAAAAFRGTVLDPIGTWDAIPALIGAALMRGNAALFGRPELGAGAAAFS